MPYFRPSKYNLAKQYSRMVHEHIGGTAAPIKAATEKLYTAYRMEAPWMPPQPRLPGTDLVGPWEKEQDFFKLVNNADNIAEDHKHLMVCVGSRQENLALGAFMLLDAKHPLVADISLYRQFTGFDYMPAPGQRGRVDLDMWAARLERPTDVFDTGARPRRKMPLNYLGWGVPTIKLTGLGVEPYIQQPEMFAIGHIFDTPSDATPAQAIKDGRISDNKATDLTVIAYRNEATVRALGFMARKRFYYIMGILRPNLLHEIQNPRPVRRTLIALKRKPR